MDDDADILNKLEAVRGSTADILPSVGFADALMSRIGGGAESEEDDESLQRISRSTEDIGAPSGLADAVMARISAGPGPFELSTSETATRPGLDEIARVTRDLDLGPAFTDKVMAALPKRAERSVFPQGMMKSARASLFAAGFAAAAAVAFGWYTEKSAVDAAMATVDSFEDGE